MQLWIAKYKKVDKSLLFVFLALIFVSALAFFSAALSLAGKGVYNFKSAIFTQFVLGFGLGGLLAYLVSRFNYKLFRIIALGVFVFSVLASLLVFVPGLGISKGEATRWINIFGISFQPSELLKISSVLLVAHLYTKYRKKIYSDIKYSLGIPAAVLAVVGVVLFLQSDNGTLATIIAGVLGVVFAAGIRWKHILILAGFGLVAFGLLLLAKPYALERIFTYLNPSQDVLGSAYHINQAQIAVGSGQLLGRGFGQSIQKFKYLPEPTSDSIFAVFAEEFGFVGAFGFLLLYMVFLLKSIKVGKQVYEKKRDFFAYLTVVGIVFVLFAQIALNVGSMLAVVPLTGLPLPFASKGGSSLLVLLAGVGIIFAVSREINYKRRASKL